MYQYDPLQGRLTTALSFAHSVVPSTLGRVEFWLFFGLQVSLYMLYWSGLLKHFPGFENTAREQTFDWKEVQITCAFTVFFEVFYTNVCYHRYVDYYHKTRAFFLEIVLVVYDLRIFIKNTHPQHARLAYRYFLASVLLFWDTVNETRQVDALINTINHFKPQLLLSKEESFLLQLHRDHRYIVTLHWSMDAFVLGHREAGLPANISKMVLDKMQKGFHLLQGLDDQLCFPIPYPYFHLLNLMVCINLILLAICMGFAGSHLDIIVFFMADLTFLGMMELASQLTDPFGNDEVDFPLALWLRTFFQRSELLMEYFWQHGSHSDSWRPLLESHEEPFRLELDIDVEGELTTWQWMTSFFVDTTPQTTTNPDSYTTSMTRQDNRSVRI